MFVNEKKEISDPRHHLWEAGQHLLDACCVKSWGLMSLERGGPGGRLSALGEGRLVIINRTAVPAVKNVVGVSEYGFPLPGAWSPPVVSPHLVYSALE